MSDTFSVAVAVVGGGQAGLAAGYHLSRAGIEHVILDAQERIGDTWRKRWGTLRLFTPARIDGLPGRPFPAGPRELPGKDEMADYLEAYANEFRLPVRSGFRATRLEGRNGRYVVTTNRGAIEADQVIIATGANQTPRMPAFASQLDPGIKQLSAGDYHDPAELNPGGVLVAGAGNSGAEIALEASHQHSTWLSGRNTGAGNPRIFTPPLWWIGTHLLTRSTPPGRRMIARLSSGGAPLMRIKPEDLAAAGVKRVGRTTGVSDGKPQLENGEVLDVSNVVWCMGFGQDFSWIQLPVFDERGAPIHTRGVVESQPGLYFLGLPFMYGVQSALIGGVGGDAAYIVRRIKGSGRRETTP
jgi:putative flavoprotein involved in K+ transport